MIKKLFLPIAVALSLTNYSSAALVITFTEQNDDLLMEFSGSVDMANSFVSDNATFVSGIPNGVYAAGVSSISPGLVISERYSGVDLLSGDLGNGSASGGATSGADLGIGFIISGGQFFFYSPSFLDNNVADITTFSTSRSVTYSNRTFASTGLDAHAQDVVIDLWGARVGATDAEKVQFVVSSAGSSSVPEPSSFFLSSLGALSLLLRRKR